MTNPDLKKKKKRGRQKIRKLKEFLPDPKPSQRKIGDPITLTNLLWGTDIQLTITATYQNLKKLKHYIYNVVPLKEETGNRPIGYLGDDIIVSFVRPALARSKEAKTEPETRLAIHGSELPEKDAHKKRVFAFVRDMKILSALLYIFFSYWFKQHSESRPLLLSELELPVDFKDALQKEVKSLPSLYTAWCMEHAFGEIRTLWKILPFYDHEQGCEADSFWATYIHKGRKILQETSDNETLDAVYAAKLLQGGTLSYPKCPKIYDLIWSLPRAYLSLYSCYSDFCSDPNDPAVQALKATFPKRERYEDRRKRLGIDNPDKNESKVSKKLHGKKSNTCRGQAKMEKKQTEAGSVNKSSKVSEDL